MWLTLLPAAAAGDLLFVGNSYVAVGELDQITRYALDQTGDAGLGSRLAEDGFRWTDHVARVETPGTGWATALLDPASSWTWGILQEQSQIPGLDPESSDREVSLDAALALDGWVAARGGETVLMMTWGRRDGDPAFPVEYPDYDTMQARLADGYLATRDALSTADRPVWVAPVGLAWQVVHDDDPDAFERLYQADGSHPASGGTWLAACVITATLTGEDPRTLTPPPGVDPALATIVADAAAAVVLEGRTGGRTLSYPWEPAATTTADPTATATAADPSAPGEVPGCGCGVGGRAGGWAVLLGLLRRRVRRA